MQSVGGRVRHSGVHGKPRGVLVDALKRLRLAAACKRSKAPLPAGNTSVRAETTVQVHERGGWGARAVAILPEPLW